MSDGNHVDSPRQRPRYRAWCYAVLNLAFATLYVVISTMVAPDGSFTALSYGLALATVLAGVGTVLRQPWARWLAIMGCAVVLVGAFVLILLTVMASAYLHGIYGAIGKGASLIVIVVVLLVIQLYGLWPIFQLRYLLARTEA